MNLFDFPRKKSSGGGTAEVEKKKKNSFCLILNSKSFIFFKMKRQRVIVSVGWTCCQTCFQHVLYFYIHQKWDFMALGKADRGWGEEGELRGGNQRGRWEKNKKKKKEGRRKLLFLPAFSIGARIFESPSFFNYVTFSRLSLIAYETAAFLFFFFFFPLKVWKKKMVSWAGEKRL